MSELLKRARTYLDALEADRLAALAVSEEAAAEAKLIKARLDGFRAALTMFGRHIPEDNIGTSKDLVPQPETRISSIKHQVDDPKPNRAAEATQRRRRRNIRDLITRELSFSGKPMTARQIAKAIEYTLARTETALEQMKKGGQVHRGEAERWAIGTLSPTSANGHVAGVGNWADRKPPNE